MGRVEEFLHKREEGGLLRILTPAQSRESGKILLDGNEYSDFSSNDYLGLSQHPRLKDASINAVRELGTSSSASRLLSGDLGIHHQLEDEVAEFKNKEAALIFNSGYQANVSIISALCNKDDVIFSDRLNHASIVDGILLSRARFFRFHHNDIEHLGYLLKKERHKFNQAIIVTETVFSMDGDRPRLKELLEIKDRYGCQIMVDEAHATGIFGANGAGIAEDENLSAGIELIMGTFSKALGSFGAYLATSKAIKDYLINSCRGFIYSTALPPAVIAANSISIDLVREESFRRRTLLENADYFRLLLSERGLKTRGSSQIVPLILGDTQKAVKLSAGLKEKGYWAPPIRPPTVPADESRLRFSLTYRHSRELLSKLADDICEIRDI